MPRSFPTRLFSVVLSTMLVGAATVSARADDCSNEKSLKSAPTTKETELSFQNRSGEKRRVYWIDFEGGRKFYGIVDPGNVLKQPTLVDHAWVVTDDAEKCLYTFVSSAEPRTVDIGEAAAAVAPPPGAQQPIAQVAPPPAMVQSAPVSDPSTVAPAPAPVAPPPVAVSQAAPPPQQAAAEQLPQVSPVEQFRLSGAYRVTPRNNASIALNSEASGTIYVISVKPEWTSSQWAFEAVPGTPFVRIRNQWKNTYLADVSGKVRAIALPPAAVESHWTFEPVDGTSFIQFRNRETERFLIAAGDAASLVNDYRQDQEPITHWSIGPASRSSPVAARAPRNSAYDAAVANCRELGGYWTGSSCRAALNSQPLACPRGYVWSEDVGDCQWDGGSCPPWQIGPGGTCMTDLTCNGGIVRLSRRGYPACYCPVGSVAWGDYPNLSCVPSVARVAPYLVPAVIGGVAVGIIGQVYGNSRVCPPGQTGKPPNCLTAATCPAPLVGTPPNCQRLVQPVSNPAACPAGQVRAPNDACVSITCAGGTMSQGACVCPVGSTLTGGGANFRCVTSQAITCTGGKIEQGVCGCPAGTQLSGGGNNFQCVASNPICNLGERLVDGKCVNLNAAITCTGGKIEQGVCGCPAGTQLSGGGNNFQGVSPNSIDNLDTRLVYR